MMIDKLTDDIANVLDDLQRVMTSVEILAYLLNVDDGHRLPDPDLARYAHHLISQALLINETATSFLEPWQSRLEVK
ncbi:hypothetical protein [Phormidium sp. FACHB-1136]|uniref:hypothetical protein n=1 Tax=Phormidium sp. FACHB-1136 TaxID=2692848 RepID=UPI001682B576|nr:hypothetical protein [Phormidium sp. FACHB-1136]MBD2429430.1 hypothetical protein [Phormidium sp. FACHB-1136]